MEKRAALFAVRRRWIAEFTTKGALEFTDGRQTEWYVAKMRFARQRWKAMPDAPKAVLLLGIPKVAQIRDDGAHRPAERAPRNPHAF